MESRKGLAVGCSVIFVMVVIAFGLGILFSKYWL